MNYSIQRYLFVILSVCSIAQAQSISESHPLRQLSSYSHPKFIIGNDPSLENAFNRYLKTGQAPHIITDGFVRFAYNVGQQPIVKTTPFQETVITLEPGEKFSTISSGDPNRWSYAVAVSGSGLNQQQNILVKPSLPDISTNLIIATDKRLYTFRLVSSGGVEAARMVSFWYPEEMMKTAKDAAIQESETEVAQIPDVSLNNLNFAYSLSHNGFWYAPSWKPTQVFDDGVHTYLQFPSSMANRDMPVLFILENNHKELVNYRSKPPYFVVDKLFKRAVLIMGVGFNQEKITLTNHQYL